MTDDQAVERMVRQNVLVCLSSMVSTLAKVHGLVRPERALRATDGNAALGLIEQAAELCAPVLDYEEAARQAGWTCVARDPEPLNDEKSFCWVHDEHDTESSAEEACAASVGDPYEWEIFEHWAVSDWLAEKLEAAGERIDRDFAGLCVWGRTHFGQGIAQDGVIQRICAQMMAPAGKRDSMGALLDGGPDPHA